MQDSKIEWTTHTFNPWIGCAKVSAGCKNCYAETLMDTRYGRAKWGPNGTRTRTSKANWRKPIQWNKAAQATGIRPRVFCSSLADVFENFEGLNEIRDDLFQLIILTPHLNWLLLTKRPENVMNMVPPSWAEHLPFNVWVGVSVENQKTADERIPLLLQIPAAVRFLSCEPLLGPVDLSKWLYRTLSTEERNALYDSTGGGEAYCLACSRAELHNLGINWVIVGGESGHGARPMHPDWLRNLRDQCQAVGVAFFFKQWGEWWPIYSAGDDPDDKGRSVQALPDGTVTYTGWNGGVGPHLKKSQSLWKHGKHAVGRLLDGKIHNAFPQPSLTSHIQ